ncbi:Predicted arabinose efflux permease, MFS family [Kaistia soli DSM 19436]|uniref:Predicted arabinose efflux permease, MFS family n=1 Tax=Kaistia soli DSM 19436 TaxID=1122133 RepID=A0A1M4U3N7_9HYPH|nr:MFS transporter [Kaistia soli]SHE51421.1 Predicted arabinose efflux permease, MFS family [Kaistia soli DSM 19436]
MEQRVSTVSKRKHRGMQATLALSMLLASLGTSIANIALPTLTNAFAASFSEIQWVVVGYLAALTVSVVFVGRLGDVYGLRRMYLLGLGLFAAASLFCGLAPNLGLLICARLLQGIGAAFLMTLSMALMRESANDAQVGRAMGLLGTVSALGTALGPSLGGVLIGLTGWRGIFLVQLPLVLMALVLALATLPRGMTNDKAAPPPLWAVLNRAILPSLLVNVLVAAVMMSTLVVGPFYLSLALGLRGAMVGLVMSVGPLISIAAGVPSGRMVDALGLRRVLAIGLFLLAAGAFLLAILPGLIGVGGYVLAITVLTPGYQLFQSANNTAVLADIPKARRGTVSGLLTLSRNVGLIAGASAMGAVFAVGVGTSDFAHANTAAIAGGMRITFLLAGGLILAAIAIALAPAGADLRGKTVQPSP